MAKFKIIDINPENPNEGLAPFIEEITKISVLNINPPLKKLPPNAQGNELIDINQEIDFFNDIEDAKWLFSQFDVDFLTNEAAKQKWQTALTKVSNAPIAYFDKKVINITIQIADFFEMSAFKSDENPTELGEPRIRKRVFLDFINQIKIVSNGQINLPYPPFKGSGLDEEFLYDGFLDAYFAASIFDDFLSMVVAVKEEEDNKAARFANDFETKMNVLVSNPERYIHSVYLRGVKSYEDKQKKTNWLKNFTRTTNRW